MRRPSGYLVSGELDQKEKHKLTETVEIYIARDFENNLRKRNPQVGTVEALPLNNPLDLQVGDKVLVNHWTFFGDIGDTRDYVLQPHVKHEEVKLFPITPREIYAKVVDGELIPVTGTLFCEKVVKEETVGGIYAGEEEIRDRGIVTHGSERYPVGTELVTKTHALYGVEFEGKEYFRLFEDHIMAVVKNGFYEPVEGHVLVKDLPEKESDIILTEVPKDVKAEVIWSSDARLDVGDTVYRYRKGGTKVDDLVLVTLEDESIHFKIC